MTTDYYLNLSGIIPFRTIDGVPQSIWSYTLTWTDKVQQQLSTDTGTMLALSFSSRINIRDPKEFLDAPDILKDTMLKKNDTEGVQYLYRDVQGAVDKSLTFYFIAPSEVDKFTAIKLSKQSPSSASWTVLPFTASSQNNPALQQIISGPAVVATAQPILLNETRSVPKCTHVPLIIPLENTAVNSTSSLSSAKSNMNGQAFIKASFIRQLSLKPGEVTAVTNTLSNLDPTFTKTLLDVENAKHPSPSIFANLRIEDFQTFGQGLVTLRKQQINLAPFNMAIIAIKFFESAVHATPIGMLHLERIDMTPAGIERGALLATIPLAPLERTAVVHKEWSVTTKEFTSIVTDSLENYSETGVTDNTELAQATTSQTSHSNQFNITGTVSGSYGITTPVTAAVSTTITAGLTSQDQNSASATESRKHAIATTRKASSRMKQEHKVTISTTTVTGTSETSTRILQNPSKTDPIRIDYFSMMRKWHVGLYRYGARMTYDIAIPEPGAAMREIYAELELQQNQIKAFEFKLAFNDVTTDVRPPEAEPHYLVLAERYQTSVPVPPEQSSILNYSIPLPTSSDNDRGIKLSPFSFDIPEKQWIVKCTYVIDANPTAGHDFNLWISGAGPDTSPDFHGHDSKSSTFIGTLHSAIDHKIFLEHTQGHQTIMLNTQDLGAGVLHLRIEIEPTDSAMNQWKIDVWNTLYNAAQTQYYAKQQDIQAQISALENKISNVDTLTLRREENEEIMKGVLRWLLGPAFAFVPKDVVDVFTQHKPVGKFGNPSHGVMFTGNDFGDPAIKNHNPDWKTMFAYQEMVKFINQAIEWENVLYFLYSYFWDVPQSWDFIRQIRHPDAIRQAFLRSGSARVVLTVRKGWEESWINFVETGSFQQILLPDHPYMSIAQEIAAYDSTNYPGIPPANRGNSPLPDFEAAVAIQSKAVLNKSTNPVTIEVDSSEGFLIGYTAVIDSWDTKIQVNGQMVTVQESQKIIAVPDATHITVEKLDNEHGDSSKGLTNPFAIMQAGEKGVLIAEWFEYTPTSGTDIAVTSNLMTIS